jgi:hypothetical protein
MKLDTLIKYIMWIVFFAIVLTGLYFVMKKIGVM